MSSGTLREVHRTGRPEPAALVRAIALGTLSGLAGVGLLAGSGLLIAKAWHRPGLAAIGGLLALIELVAIARSPLRYAERLATHDLAFTALRRWRVALYYLLVPLSPGGLAGAHSGEVLHHAVDDVDVLQDLYLRVVVPTSSAGATAVLTTIVTAAIVPLAGLSCLLGALVVVGAAGVATVIAQGTATAQAAAAGRVAALVADGIEGAAELTAYGTWSQHLEAVEVAARAERRAARRHGLAQALGSAGGLLGIGLAVLGSTIAAMSAAHQGHLGADAVPALALGVVGGFEPLLVVIASALSVDRILAAAHSVFGLSAAAPPVPVGSGTVAPGAPDLEIIDAHLRYRDAIRPSLDGLDLHLAAGQLGVITGPSGSGKSTALIALLGLWPLESGKVLIGGQPITDLDLRLLRAGVGVQLTDARLFSGSLADNLRLADPTASDELLTAVLEEVGLSSLAGGLDRAVGEAGRNLSGGERRRVAVARALLVRGGWLLLDEPLAHLDEHAANQVRRALIARRHLQTILVTSHDRFEGADATVDLAGGRRVSRSR